MKVHMYVVTTINIKPDNIFKLYIFSKEDKTL